MRQEGTDPFAASPGADPFDNLVLDDDFVRGGSYEPPARTRVAIARYGGRQTSWRHGGGLHDQSRTKNAATPATVVRGRRRPRAVPDARHESRFGEHRGGFSSSASSRLPLIVSLVVVAIAALLMFG
jgi:hypothetical protein